MFRCFGVALAATLLAGSVAAQAPTVEVYEFQGSAPWFGGFSAIEVDEAGRKFRALTDGGTLVHGAFERTQGRITGHSIEKAVTLTQADSSPLKDWETDTEGLEWDSKTGDMFISGEAEQAIWRVDDGRMTRLPTSKVFHQLPQNGRLEAIAQSPSGALYVIPERPGPINKGIPIYRLNGETWDIAANLPRSAGFVVTGADFDETGQLWVVERAFNGFGFRSRIRRINLETGRARNLFTSGYWDFGNLEGISVRRTQTSFVATLISDDNFRPVLPSQIVEITFALGKPPTKP